MASTVNLNGERFPPSFGYLDASAVCRDVNAANPTWGVVLQFESSSSFSFSSINAQYGELRSAVMGKLGPLLESSHSQPFAYAQGSDVFLASGQEKHLYHEASHVVQQKSNNN